MENQIIFLPFRFFYIFMGIYVNGTRMSERIIHVPFTSCHRQYMNGYSRLFIEFYYEGLLLASGVDALNDEHGVF